MLTLKSEFAEIPQYIAKPTPDNKPITVESFKKLIQEAQEDGSISKKELLNLQSKVDAVKGQTKKDLLTLLSSITIINYNNKDKVDGTNTEDKSSVSPTEVENSVNTVSKSVEPTKSVDTKEVKRKVRVNKLINRYKEGNYGEDKEMNELVKELYDKNVNVARKTTQAEMDNFQRAMDAVDYTKQKVVENNPIDTKKEKVETKEKISEKFRKEYIIFRDRSFKGSKNPTKYTDGLKQYVSAYKSSDHINNYRVKMDDGTFKDLRLNEKEATDFNHKVDTWNKRVNIERGERKEAKAKKGAENLQGIKDFLGFGDSSSEKDGGKKVDNSTIENNESKGIKYATEVEFKDQLNMLNSLTAKDLKGKTGFLVGPNGEFFTSGTRDVIRDGKRVKVHLTQKQALEWNQSLKQAKTDKPFKKPVKESKEVSDKFSIGQLWDDLTSSEEKSKKVVKNPTTYSERKASVEAATNGEVSKEALTVINNKFKKLEDPKYIPKNRIKKMNFHINASGQQTGVTIHIKVDGANRPLNKNEIGVFNEKVDKWNQRIYDLEDSFDKATQNQ